MRDSFDMEGKIDHTEDRQMRGYEARQREEVGSAGLGYIGQGRERDYGAKAAPSANDVQHGGKHYKGSEYQHWDWVNDIGLNYHLGNASKYAFRFPNKNGAEDIEKSLHYLQKQIELTHGTDRPNAVGDESWRLRITEMTLRLGTANKLSGRQVQILTWIALGEINAAGAMLTEELNSYAVVDVATPRT
jgi:hypothetical protein